MIWPFKKISAEFDAWDIDSADFLSDDLSNYKNPKTQLELLCLRELIPEHLQNEIFICGGFAAHVAGITTEHTDCDLFCTNQSAFLDMQVEIESNPKVVVTHYNQYTYSDFEVIKFKYEDFKFDLINYIVYDKDYSGDIRNILMQFDFNWVMAGINLSNNTITIHPKALSKDPIVQPIVADQKLHSLTDRIAKYSLRLKKRVNIQERQRLLGITENRLAARVKTKELVSRLHTATTRYLTA